MRYRSLGWLGLALAAALGCEAGAGAPTVPVTGRVTLGDDPVVEAEVVFLNRAREGKPAKGMTDKQGNFTLTTFVGGKKHVPGALPGEYDVTVTKREATAAPSGPGGADDLTNPGNMEVMKKQREEETRKIIASGKTGPDAAAEISPNVYGKPEPAHLLPEKYSNLKTSELEAIVKEGGDNQFDLKLEE